ncbi:hypothetical protein BXT86_04765 [candidate division WOR-3 bacterium 4484_100]|uniref:Uncharacterized protein n=1 Tax=candidate division WOR-3 bacterium 4484_100 TaxID=1936077 RepID=A0A1V4QEK7_UNCW3|nr:MAG: hypothetical protein BXT86_04765 [candidate division WOR-3 bacterium 4484_100]
MGSQKYILLLALFAQLFLLRCATITRAPVITPEQAFSRIVGSSFENAVKINADNSFEGIKAEYDWLEEHFPGYKFKEQALMIYQGKPYDCLTIITKDGVEKMIYFDISSFFGK